MAFIITTPKHIVLKHKIEVPGGYWEKGTVMLAVREEGWRGVKMLLAQDLDTSRQIWLQPDDWQKR